MSSASARKELRDLGKIIRKNGYKVAPGGKGGHLQILDSKGRKVIDENGPVIMSSTPSDFRARDLAAARLIRAGVLRAEQLPWKPQKKDEGPLLGGEDEKTEEELDARHRAAVKLKDEARSRHERTQIIRGRLEPIVTRLGGWTKRGLLSEMADVAYNYNKGAAWGFPSLQAAKANATSLRKGGTLSDDRATCWEALLDDLEQAPVMRERWFDLVRAARGLPSRVVPAAAYRPGSVVEGEADRPIVVPGGGSLVEEMERQYEAPGRWARRNGEEEHPLLEMHGNGGVRWPVDFTIDDLNELSRAVGFFEGLAVQLSFFDGQELVEPALEKVRALVERVGEARFRELARRGQVAGAPSEGGKA